MTHSKKLEKAYAGLMELEGPKNSPRLYRKSIMLVMFNLLHLMDVDHDGVIGGMDNSIYELYMLYIFFDEMDAD